MTSLQPLGKLDLLPMAMSAGSANPGSIGAQRAHYEGVLGRREHTEAAVDLARLAGRTASGVICEVANDDETMARLPDLERFAERHSLLLVAIEDLQANLSHKRCNTLTPECSVA